MELRSRQNLINSIEIDGLSIKEAASLNQINYSTAKHIYKLYKRTGMVENKVDHMKIRQITSPLTEENLRLMESLKEFSAKSELLDEIFLFKKQKFESKQ